MNLSHFSKTVIIDTVKIMKSIKEPLQCQYIIQGSKFIGMLFPVHNQNEIDSLLKQLNNQYQDATHLCYAYKIDSKKRIQEDGEPSGTSGVPMLSIIEAHDFNHVLAVVIRYFGGTKLGTGGLVRAYSKGILDCFAEAKIIYFEKGVFVKLCFPYCSIRLVDSILMKQTINEKSFTEDVTYIFTCSNDFFDSHFSLLEQYAKIEILKKNIWCIENS